MVCTVLLLLALRMPSVAPEGLSRSQPMVWVVGPTGWRRVSHLKMWPDGDQYQVMGGRCFRFVSDCNSYGCRLDKVHVL